MELLHTYRSVQFSTRRHRQKQRLYTLPNIWSRGIHFRAATLTLWPACYAELLMVQATGRNTLRLHTAGYSSATGTDQHTALYRGTDMARLNTAGLRGPTQKTDFICWRR